MLLDEVAPAFYMGAVFIFAILVCSPLDRADVDPVLVHIPQRRQFAQLADFVLDQINGEVDIFFGRETADGKTNRAVRQFVAASQGAQHVRRFQAGRSASRAGRDRDVLDRHDQGFAFDVVEADVQVVRHTVFHVAVDIGLFDLLQTLGQTIAHGADVGQFGFHFFAGDAEGFAHADDLMRCQCAGTQTALVTTTVDLRFDTHTWFAANVQRADTLGTVSLVRRETHQVDFPVFQIDLDLAGCLRSIAMENDALRTAEFADFRYRLNHADFVVDQHDRDQDGVGTHGCGDLLDSHQTIVLRLQVSRFETLTLQFAESIQHSLVLGLDRDDVLTLGLVELCSTLDCQVVAFGRTGSPDDFARIRVDQLGDFFACIFHGLLCGPAIHV